MKDKRFKELLIHHLTQDELLKYAREQSAALRDLRQVEGQLASIKSDYKAKTEALENSMSLCARRIGDGYEMRETECMVRYHFPAEGVKTVIRLDTGEIVRELRMSPEEAQEVLPLEA